MRHVYCDNGSTSFPKAPGLGTAIGRHIEQNGYNISRGSYQDAYSVEGKVIAVREMLCEMFCFSKPQGVVFTPGATAGLNMVLKGILKKGDHVITTSIEHNAVVRPLTQLKEQGICWEEAPCNREGELDIKKFEALIRKETKLVLMLHASNVCGTMIPIEEVGKICSRHSVCFAVDASQSAGSCSVDMEQNHIDILVFPGHKGLMGPQGIGGLILTDQAAAQMEPLIAGGTGSVSDLESMPDFLPDKFQPGTLNLPGIIGMGHALEFIKKEGIAAIQGKKEELTGQFLEDVLNMKGVRLVGRQSSEGRCAVVSLDLLAADNAEVSYILEQQFGIMTRCGLHCAPHAHRTLGTFPQGTVRFSFGYFNTKEELHYVVDALNQVLNELRE